MVSFKGLKDRIVELKIGGEVVKVKPKLVDAEAFITMKREMTAQDAKSISKIVVDMIARASPQENREDIEAFVVRHYGDVLTQVAVVFGFTTESQLEATKKKLMAET